MKFQEGHSRHPASPSSGVDDTSDTPLGELQGGTER